MSSMAAVRMAAHLPRGLHKKDVGVSHQSLAAVQMVSHLPLGSSLMDVRMVHLSSLEVSTWMLLFSAGNSIFIIQDHVKCSLFILLLTPSCHPLMTMLGSEFRLSSHFFLSELS